MKEETFIYPQDKHAPIAPDTKLSLFPFQEVGVEWLLNHPRAILADEMGLGKSVEVSAALKKIFEQWIVEKGRLPRTLILCPLAVRQSWLYHLQTWTGDPRPENERYRGYEFVTIVEGETNEKRLQRLDRVHGRDQVAIMNYESFLRLGQFEIPSWLYQWDIIVADEAHRVKNRDTQLFRFIKRFCPAPRKVVTIDQSGASSAPRRWVPPDGVMNKLSNRDRTLKQADEYDPKHSPSFIWLLTGTPIINRSDDLWSQLHLIDKKTWSSYWKFVDAYCDRVYNGFGWVVEPIVDPDHPKVKKLSEDLTPFVLKRSKEDVKLDLPPKIVRQQWMEIDGTPVLKPYRQMERDFLATLERIAQDDESITVSAPIVIAQITRLKQICIDPSLIAPLDDPLNDLSRPLDPTCPKIAAIIDMIRSGDVPVSNQSPLVIFSQFAQALTRLKVNLQSVVPHLDVELFTGLTDHRKRDEILRTFQRGEGPAILLISTSAGGVGLTLTQASKSIFLDKMWSPALNLQAQDRLHRIGQGSTVEITEILLLNTIEEKIEWALSRKLVQSQNVWSLLKSMYPEMLVPDYEEEIEVLE